MSSSLYDRVKALADSPYGEASLAAVAFAESSFFPIPPDILLAPMALADPRRAWRFALIATVASVMGGMLGYAIGALLYQTVGQWLVNLYGYGPRMEALKETYAQWGWLVILIKGVTPIPYKLVTIASGAAHFDLFTFVWASIVTRGARFIIVAALLWKFGEPIRAFIEQRLTLVTWLFLIALVGGFVAFRYLF